MLIAERKRLLLKIYKIWNSFDKKKIATTFGYQTDNQSKSLVNDSNEIKEQAVLITHRLHLPLPTDNTKSESTSKTPVPNENLFHRISGAKKKKRRERKIGSPFFF